MNHERDHVPDRIGRHPLTATDQQSFIKIFLAILQDDLRFISHMSSDVVGAILEKGPFVIFILAFYAFTLCAVNMEVCKQNWVVSMPLIAIQRKGLRAATFEYFFQYMCVAHLYQAFIEGVPWALRDSATLTHAQTHPQTSARRKGWIYVSNLVAVALGLILQPLLIFYISKEFGKHSFRGIPGPEFAVYTSLALHGLRIVFEAFEQLSYNRGWPNVSRLTLIRLLGIVASTFDIKPYLKSTEISTPDAWKLAGQYNALGNTRD